MGATSRFGLTGALGALLGLQLAAHYLLKTLREPLVLAEVGAEGKALATGAQVVLLVPALAAYDAAARRWAPARVSAVLLALGAVGAGVLGVLADRGAPVGLALHLGFGVFGLLAVSQTWSLAADLLARPGNDPAGAERAGGPLAGIGLGGALGAIAGSLGAAWLVPRAPASAAFFLAAGAVAMVAVGHHLLGRARRALPARTGGRRPLTADKPAAQLVAGDRYLRLVAASTVLASLVGTLGEYLLDRALVDAVGGAAAAPAAQQEIAAFKGRFYGVVNVAALVLQGLLAARPLALRSALRIPPAVAAAGFAVTAALPGVAWIATVKAADASLGHSLQATLRHALYLRTTPGARYRAKALIDTALWRAGDLAAGALVGLGAVLGVGTPGFAAVNAVLSVGWLGVVGALDRAHRGASAGRAARRPHRRQRDSTMNVPPLPGRSTRSRAVPSASARATSRGAPTAARSASTMTSPGRSPARCAGEPGATWVTTTRPSPR